MQDQDLAIEMLEGDLAYHEEQAAVWQTRAEELARAYFDFITAMILIPPCTDRAEQEQFKLLSIMQLAVERDGEGDGECD